MSYYAFKNNLKATLHYDMTDTDTVIWLKQLVTSTDPDTRLAAWPTCDASRTFTLTLESTEDSKIREIVECTGVTANTTDYIAFSCTRAKENTVAIAHNKNATNVENRITAAALTTIVDALTTTMASVTTNTASISTITSSVNALSSTLIGSIQSVMASSTYVPNGCVLANGGEYTRAQFPTLYDEYLVGGKLLTCTYTAQATQVGLTGNCGKFALDTANQKFKVPLLKDGDSITQAASAAEIGKSVKAGLPDLIGTLGIRTGYETTGVFEQVVNSSGATLGAFGSIDANPITSKPQIRASKCNPIYGNSTTVTDEQVRLRHFVVVASAQNNASVFDWSAYMTALAGKADVSVVAGKANTDLSNVTVNAIKYVFSAYDSKPQNTQGGTSASNAWQTRDLNTIGENTLGGTLASNQFTLPAGTYRVFGSVSGFRCGTFCGALYNVSTGTYLLHGTSEATGADASTSSRSLISDVFTIATAQVFELRMWSQVSYGTVGLGSPADVPSRAEKYSEVTIWKV